MATEDLKPASGQLEPPSSLHTKLQTILDDEVNNPIREGEGVDPKSYFGIDNDDIIAQILQALQEEGYVNPTNVQVNTWLMSGEYWYDRFKAELGTTEWIYRGKAGNSEGYSPERVVQAARVAAGLPTEGEG